MKLKIKPFSDYLIITPDVPTGGTFSVGDTYIEEQGVVEDVGPDCTDAMKALKGKRVLFNAWSCDEKTIGGQKFYFATEQANTICAIL